MLYECFNCTSESTDAYPAVRIRASHYETPPWRAGFIALAESAEGSCYQRRLSVN